MIHVSILASGSSGNAILAKAGGTSVLIDAGLSAKRLNSLLESLETPPETLAGVLLTHEHVDHTRGLKGLCGKIPIQVFANPLTADSLRKAGTEVNWRFFASGAAFQVGDFNIHPFSVPHDAADPVGFLLATPAGNIGFLTDLGHATKLILERVKPSNLLVLEANYDVKLLQEDTRRPWSTKQRIASRHGHLSNHAASEVATAILHDGLRRIYLGHLSRDCNTPELARKTVGAALDAAGANHVQLENTSQDTPSPTVTL
jgi:phosphoribosyl 1,2-cyclic phosphodiesterase